MSAPAAPTPAQPKLKDHGPIRTHLRHMLYTSLEVQQPHRLLHQLDTPPDERRDAAGAAEHRLQIQISAVVIVRHCTAANSNITAGQSLTV